MEIKHTTSLKELEALLDQTDKTYLLIYKKGSDQSDCAFQMYQEAAKNIDGIQLLAVDVNNTKDIHPHFQISTAPTMLEFEKRQPGNTIKGCHDSSYFKAMLEDAVYRNDSKKEGSTQKRVIVYSTPTCSWCTTLKSYFKQNNIRYTDIDISRNASAAKEMARKSGQQGVPQTDIDGTMIVGFDKIKINQLLEIKS
jgi:glutaredoxin-like YruB-family protein